LAMLLDEWRLGPLAYELLFAAARNPIDSPLGTAALLPRLLASKLKSLEQLASSYPYFFVS
ncbi:MAG: hypothetical protein IJ125_05220, partial [Atopobiaceae bacterium]|nr:hypothetical protein [Atopobiaceae bacterium]